MPDSVPNSFQRQSTQTSGANMLPIHIRGGIHYNLLASDTVTFVLYAPFKPYVSLVGDFNEWNSRAHRMVTDGRGIWWTTIPHPGATRYGYYVAVDDQSHVWVGDPYATQVKWTEQGAWAYLPPHATAFPWHDQQWQTPALRDLLIYELCVRDFAGAWQANRPRYGTFRTMLPYVDYLADLGVNAIEIMPIQAFPGDSSWGYNPVFYFAPAQSYGTPDDFKQLVDTCHTRGLAVILDVAFNHAWGQHPYYQMYPPMYGPKGELLADWNPFFHHTPAVVNGWGGVDWDHFAPETTTYFQDVVRFWLQEYHVDGFRFDWVCGVDYDSNDPMNGGFNPYHGISAIGWAARQVKPDCILVGEFWQLDGTSYDKTAAKLVQDTPLDAYWNGDFHHVLDDILNQRWEWEKRDIFRAIGGFRENGLCTATQMVNYSCSHDEVRPEHEIIFYSQSHIARPDGMTVQQLAHAKAFLGLVTLLTAPGIPMVYAGQEFGEDSPRTIDFQPLHWDKLEQPLYQRYFCRIKHLLAIRRAHPALASDHIRFYANDFAAEQVVRFERVLYGEDRQKPVDIVVVALNFGGMACTIELPLPWPGRWQDLLTDQIYSVRQAFRLTLAPWQGAVLAPAF